MEFWVNLLTFLQSTMTRPHSYGWFHFMWVGIIVLATTLLCLRFRNADDRTFRRIVLILWVAMVLFETHKQLMYTFSVSDGIIVGDYQWYAFPYQLCGTPLFVLPVVIWGKDGHLRDAVMAFICFFSFFGGLVTYVYPEDVFISEIGINVQSMFHHGMQIVLGIFTAVHLRHRFNRSLYYKGAVAFVALCASALVMDVSMYHILKGCGIDETFNMFYISPYYECSLPLLNMIDQVLPYVPFLALYVLGFLLIGFIMYSIQYGFIRLASRQKKT